MFCWSQARRAPRSPPPQTPHLRLHASSSFVEPSHRSHSNAPAPAPAAAPTATATTGTTCPRRRGTPSSRRAASSPPTGPAPGAQPTASTSNVRPTSLIRPLRPRARRANPPPPACATRLRPRFRPRRLGCVADCSSDLWSGDADASPETWNWNFKGSRIVVAVINDLMQTQARAHGGLLLLPPCRGRRAAPPSTPPPSPDDTQTPLLYFVFPPHSGPREVASEAPLRRVLRGRDRGDEQPRGGGADGAQHRPGEGLPRRRRPPQHPRGGVDLEPRARDPPGDQCAPPRASFPAASLALRCLPSPGTAAAAALAPGEPPEPLSPAHIPLSPLPRSGGDARGDEPSVPVVLPAEVPGGTVEVPHRGVQAREKAQPEPGVSVG